MTPLPRKYAAQAQAQAQPVHRASKDKALRNLRSNGLSRAEPGDVSAFLVNFLAHRGIKARTVLKEADLNPDNLHDAFAVRALFEAALPA